MSKKSEVAKLSIYSNACLIAMKFIVGFITGSVSIISEAIHSTMDLMASFVAFFSVKLSAKPPDITHPYGYEKIENISGIIETVLIFLASLFIIKEAVHKLFNRGEVTSPGLGFLVMLISAAVNYFVSARLYAVARSEGSIAIEADALHLKADVYTSIGVAAGLLMLWISGFQILDPLVAILIAIFILKEAIELFMHSFGPLVDIKLPEEELELLKKSIYRYRDTFVDVHDLRTRRSGNIKHISMHMTFPYKMTVEDFNDTYAKIKMAIEAMVKDTRTLVYGEPCDKNCSSCRFDKTNKLCI
ncbi:MAG: cation diffusion facilitator family transporter [Elusimicrobia bacterium]|nr:cation diffusion facilitator family transporter [Candidatus Liberimonas magnetica]